MASPYYQCPQCHGVSRKNDNMFEMVQISGPNTVFAVAGAAPCPDCGARNDFDDVYVHLTLLTQSKGREWPVCSSIHSRVTHCA